MTGLFFQSVWPGLLFWIALYISDYGFTLKCARLYKGAAGEKIVFDGSYEITPEFQRDIDSLRVFSPTFWFSLVLTAGLLFILWHTLGKAVPEAYSFLLGTLISVQLTIHLRHLRNLWLFRAAASNEVRGRIEYSRALLTRLSALELFTFFGLFIVLFAFTDSWFILGGAFGCGVLAAKHWRLARAAQLSGTNEAQADKSA